MSSHLHPKEAPKKQTGPFPSEAANAADAGRTLEAQRNDKFHGGVSVQRDATDNPVKDTKPFKKLKG